MLFRSVSVATAGSPARQVRTAIDCSFAGSKRKWEDSEKSLMSKIAGLEKELKEHEKTDMAHAHPMHRSHEAQKDAPLPNMRKY